MILEAPWSRKWKLLKPMMVTASAVLYQLSVFVWCHLRPELLASP